MLLIFVTVLCSTLHSTAHLAGTLSASHSPAFASMSCVFHYPTDTHAFSPTFCLKIFFHFHSPLSSFMGYTYCVACLCQVDTSQSNLGRRTPNRENAPP